jgi:hypothetical protein
MHTLKIKIDDSSQVLKEQLSEIRGASLNHQREIEALKQQISRESEKSQEQTQALQAQLADVLQILRSKP